MDGANMVNWGMGTSMIVSFHILCQISGSWRHTMALTTDGRLYGWGWSKFGQVGSGDNVDHCTPQQVKFPDEQKVVQISCGWRHSIAVTERKNVFSWGRGTNGQLSNTPKLIENLSADGSSCKQIESSESLSGKPWVSPSERYALVPDEMVTKRITDLNAGNGGDVNVPEKDVKRVRV